MVLTWSKVSREALFGRLLLFLGVLQIIALVAFIRCLAAGDETRLGAVLWLLGGMWIAGLWAAVQRRRARIALGIADPHRLEDALEVVAAAALAPLATALSYVHTIASFMD